MNRAGGNDIGNAEVLCEPCHQATRSFGVPGKSPPAFSQEVKTRAISNAGNRCQCTRLRTYSQKMMVAAIAMALMKAWAQRSYLVAIRRQSLSLPNMRSMRLRCL